MKKCILLGLFVATLRARQDNHEPSTRWLTPFGQPSITRQLTPLIA